MSTKESVHIQFPGLGVLLTVLFVGLKLGGIISWSWFWVCSPLIFGFVGWALLIVLFLLIAAIANR